MEYQIVLGSSSKWRKEVLQKLGYDFICMSPDIDEKAIRHPDPKEMTLMIAKAKAQALLPKVFLFFHRLQPI
jgi:septum formation protein